LTAKSRVAVVDASSVFVVSRSITARSLVDMLDAVKPTVRRKPTTAPLLAVVALLVLVLLAVVAGRRVSPREA
jgi:protein involved in temperature-dependent protein secretion